MPTTNTTTPSTKSSSSSSSSSPTSSSSSANPAHPAPKIRALPSLTRDLCQLPRFTCLSEVPLNPFARDCPQSTDMLAAALNRRCSCRTGQPSSGPNSDAQFHQHPCPHQNQQPLAPAGDIVPRSPSPSWTMMVMAKKGGKKPPTTTGSSSGA